MDTAAAYAEAVAPFEEEARRLRPDGAEVIDAHTHLGLDEDGRSLELHALLEMLDVAGARRACVFPLHDPERHPAYRVPNDRVLAWAAESEGRLVPFCRLDPADDPLPEAERCLSIGARGIKLHPRAQAFGLDDAALDPIFGLAESARVPILIHAGRGMPPIANALVGLAMRHPDVVLILAHGAIADQATLTARLADHPGILYDTSCFYPMDVIELFARAPAERVVFASDPPYGHPAPGVYSALRLAAGIGLDEEATRLVLGGTMAGLLDEGRLPAVTPPRASEAVTLPRPLIRVYSYIAGTAPGLFMRNLEVARGALDLALAVCRDPNPGAAGPALEQIARALTVAQSLLVDDEGIRPAIDLVHRCLSLAVTGVATGAVAAA